MCRLTTCITVGYLFVTKQKSLWYFQLEVDYYSSKINKNKYKNFQLKSSTKNNLKTAEEDIAKVIYLHRQLFITFCLD